MKTKMFSIYDSKAKAFQCPFVASQNGSAIRTFTTIVNDDRNLAGMYPGDFLLYEVGEFDTDNCSVNMLEPMQLLGNGMDFKREANPVGNGKKVVESPVEVV